MAYIAFNTEKAPFDNVKVRQALNYAVDKKRLLTRFIKGAGTAAKIHYHQQFGVITTKSKIIRMIQRKQKQLLAEAGYQTVLKRTSGFNQWCVRLTQIQNVWLN